MFYSIFSLVLSNYIKFIYKFSLSGRIETEKENRQPGVPVGDFSLRSLADSNRCARFCRPVTKPLIQATLRK